MSGGYTAATDAIASAAKSIGELSQHLLDANPDLSSTPITAEGFGQAHGAHSQKYTAGVQAMWDSVNGYSGTLSTLGSNLSTAGTSYSQNEDAQTGAITKAGTQ
ncbi:hypothetical protein [Amycolatopsis sp.]|jgi:uncharacterized protein YukE|uniref:hypothetical protein n=1 Tax=Amycolatopsis sp. TaxID=37632 RepID=UPI002E094D9E|nr:hypothetical protein [Amycolatopsis sp.]